MKPRDHIASVSCLLAVVIFLLIEGAATAQEFMPPPAFGPGAPSLVYGRFYVQGGVQYRNIQRLGFRRFTRAATLIQDFGAAPFGTDQEGPFGSGTGVPGYPTNPTGDFFYNGDSSLGGVPLLVDPGDPTALPPVLPTFAWLILNSGLATNPNTTGVWLYDNGGIIRPEGFYYNVFPDQQITDPVAIFPSTLWDSSDGGLGQYISTMSNGTNHFAFNGFFQIANTPDNVQNGFTIGTGATGLNFTDTTKVSFRRTLDASVNGYGNGRESLIWQTIGSEIRDKEFTANPISPVFEFGFQWTNFFDFFGSFSWYDLDANHGVTTTVPSTLMRRVIKDTFPYTASRTGTWQGTVPSNAFHYSELLQEDTGVYDFIMPDAPRNGVVPTREFLLATDYFVPPLTTEETVTMHTDVSIYEYKLGARSWQPLYGFGRIGIVLGPMLNQINYRASSNRFNAYPINGTITTSESVFNKGTLWSWGLFAGGDVEMAFNQWYGKFGAFYHLSEEKVLKNADTATLAIDTNLNLSGLNLGLNLGLRF